MKIFMKTKENSAKYKFEKDTIQLMQHKVLHNYNNENYSFLLKSIQFSGTFLTKPIHRQQPFVAVI